MSNINEEARVSLFVNGEQAESAIKRLTQQLKDYESQLESANAAGDKKGASKLRKQIAQTETQLEKMQSRMKGVGIVMENLDKTSLTGLKNTLKHLQKELDATRPETEEWRDLSDKVKVVTDRINELNGSLENSQSRWFKFKKWSEKAWPALDLIKQWSGAVIGFSQEMVDAYASMDQEMAGVRKFTGMTEEQVATLNEEFKKMDTRTSREALNQLAQEAGRLGKTSIEDVLGFVRAADQINVALDDLGEGATLTLSKLSGIFGDEARYGTEASLLKIGSVINELSQNCAASAPYLAEFTSRLGGVGAQAGLTIPQIMAYAAVLDSNGQSVERSATALSQLITRMMADPAKYASAAGIEVSKFSNLLKTDVNAALIMFLEALNSAGGMDALSPLLKEMGEKGSGAVATLSTLAAQLDAVKSQQSAASVAFQEGTSIGKEYDVQNNTVAAGLDKQKEKLADLRVEIGKKLLPVVTTAASATNITFNAISSLISFLLNNIGVITTLVAAIAAYNITVNIAIIKTKALAAAEVLLNTALTAQRLALIASSGAAALLSGNVTRATAAFKLFSSAIKANPIGLAVSLLTSAVVAISNYTAKTNEAKKAEKELAEQREKAAREFRQQISNTSIKSADYAKKELDRLKSLYSATQNTAKSQKQRIAAVKELQKTYPEAFGNLSREKILTGQAASAYESLATNIKKAARAKAAAEKIKENEGLALGLELERDELLESVARDTQVLKKGKQRRAQVAKKMRNEGALSVSGASDATKAEYAAVNEVVEKYEENLASSQSRLDEIQMQLREIDATNTKLSNYAEAGSSGPGNNDGKTTLIPLTDDTDPDSDKQEPSRFEAEEKWRNEQLLNAKIAYSKGEIDHEAYTKRMDEINIDYYSKILERQDLTDEERLQATSDLWEAINQETIHGNQRLVDAENDSYESIKALLQKNYTDRLAAGNLSAAERERCEKVYQTSLEELELNHLQNLVNLTKEGSEERQKAEKEYEASRLKSAQRHQQEYEKAQAEHAKKVDEIRQKYFASDGVDNSEGYDAALSLLTEAYNAELALAGDNADARLRIEQAFQKAKLGMAKAYGISAEGEAKNAVMRVAEWLESDGGKAFTGALGTLTSGLSSIFSGLTSLMQAELDIQTAKIESRYEKEVEYAQGNSYKVAELEKQKEEEIAKAKNEANKKMFAMQVIQAVAQTATNAINAYGSAAAIPVIGFIMAPIAAAMAVAAGAIQIAAIKKQQQAAEAQGYSEGGFTPNGAVDEEVGVVHAGEWVASQKLLANPTARSMINALDYAQRTNTIGSLRPEDVSRSIRANDSLVRLAEADGTSALVVAAVAQNAQVVDALTKRLKEPFVTVNTVTGDLGIKAAQDEYSRLISNKTPKSRKK